MEMDTRNIRKPDSSVITQHSHPMFFCCKLINNVNKNPLLTSGNQKLMTEVALSISVHDEKKQKGSHGANTVLINSDSIFSDF